MNPSSVLTGKGQITIPREVRVRLGLNQGDRVEFIMEGDRTVIRPMRDDRNAFQRYAGALGTFPGGVDEIRDWVDELRDTE